MGATDGEAVAQSIADFTDYCAEADDSATVRDEAARSVAAALGVSRHCLPALKWPVELACSRGHAARLMEPFTSFKDSGLSCPRCDWTDPEPFPLGVSLEGVPVVWCAGFLPGDWNGWALPLFSRAQLEHALAQYKAAGVVESYSFDSAGVLSCTLAGCDPEEPTAPSAAGLYAWGGYAFTWTRAEPAELCWDWPEWPAGVPEVREVGWTDTGNVPATVRERGGWTLSVEFSECDGPAACLGTVAPCPLGDDCATLLLSREGQEFNVYHGTTADVRAKLLELAPTADEWCESCDGKGTRTGFKDGGRTEVRFDCDDCDGTGRLDL